VKALSILLVVVLVVSTAIVGQRLVVVWERYQFFQERVASLTKPRTFDYRDSQIRDMLTGASAAVAGTGKPLLLAIVIGERADWLTDVGPVVKFAERTAKTAPGGLSVVIAADPGVVKEAAARLEDWGVGPGVLTIVPIEDSAVFSMRSGIAVLPQTLVFSQSRLAAIFEGLWPTESDLGGALGAARSGSLATLLQRGGSLERLGTAPAAPSQNQ